MKTFTIQTLRSETLIHTGWNFRQGYLAIEGGEQIESTSVRSASHQSGLIQDGYFHKGSKLFTPDLREKTEQKDILIAIIVDGHIDVSKKVWHNKWLHYFGRFGKSRSHAVTIISMPKNRHFKTVVRWDDGLKRNLIVSFSEKDQSIMVCISEEKTEKIQQVPPPKTMMDKVILFIQLWFPHLEETAM